MVDDWIFALQLTVIGIGMVFLVAILLWAVISLLLRWDRSEPAPRPAAASAPPSGPNPELLAAITVAVMTHRKLRRKEAAPEMRSQPPGTELSRWLAVGRARQSQGWQPRRKN